jgi:hypothetical protein
LWQFDKDLLYLASGFSQSTTRGLAMKFSSVLAAVMVLVPTLTAAQGPSIPAWPVAEGARVRVLSPVLGNEPRIGLVVSATRDSLSFREGRQPAAYTSLRTSDIRQLEISQRSRRHRFIGGLVGFSVGTVAGGFMGAATVEKGNGFARFDAAIAGAGVGGLLGAVAGALVIGRTVDTWVPVALPNR